MKGSYICSNQKENPGLRGRLAVLRLERQSEGMVLEVHIRIQTVGLESVSDG